MKNKILYTLMIVGISFFSCNDKKTETIKSETVVEQITIPNEIVRNFITNSAGVRLDMVFNNSQGTTTFTLNGETIHMKQDTMASGVRFHNDNYIFENWQGQTTLTKDGKVIFENKE